LTFKPNDVQVGEQRLEKLELYLQLAKILMMAAFLVTFIILILLGRLTITVK